MVPAENATVDAHDPSTGPLLALGTDSPEPSHAAYSVLQTKYPKGHTETQVPGAQSPVKRLVLQSEQDPRSLGSAPAAHQNHFLKFFKAPAANRPYVSPYVSGFSLLVPKLLIDSTLTVCNSASSTRPSSCNSDYFDFADFRAAFSNPEADFAFLSLHHER